MSRGVPHRAVNLKTLAGLAWLTPEEESERFRAFEERIESVWFHVESFYPIQRPNPRRRENRTHRELHERRNQNYERMRYLEGEQIRTILDAVHVLMHALSGREAPKPTCGECGRPSRLAASQRAAPLDLHDGVASNLGYFGDRFPDRGLFERLGADLPELAWRAREALGGRLEDGRLRFPESDPGGSPRGAASAEQREVVEYARIFLATLGESVRRAPGILLGEGVSVGPFSSWPASRRREAEREWKQACAYSARLGWSAGHPRSRLARFLKQLVPTASARRIQDYVREYRRDIREAATTADARWRGAEAVERRVSELARA